MTNKISINGLGRVNKIIIIISALIVVLIVGIAVFVFVSKDTTTKKLQNKNTINQNMNAVMTATPKTSETGSVVPVREYFSQNGFYKLSLPVDWVGFSPFDNSTLEFTKLEDGIISYGPKGKWGVISLESFTPDMMTKEGNRTVYQVIKDIRTDPTLYDLVSTKKQGDVTVYVHVARPGASVNLSTYYVFEKKEIVVVIGFSETDKDYSRQFQQIISSIKFLK